MEYFKYIFKNKQSPKSFTQGVPLALLFVNVPIISSSGGGGIWVVTNVDWLF
jgi:hypothetical protein